MFWLAAIRDVRGGVCGSSNQRTGVHHRAQQRRSDVCYDCVHSTGISGSPAGDRVTASLDSVTIMGFRDTMKNAQ